MLKIMEVKSLFISTNMTSCLYWWQKLTGALQFFFSKNCPSPAQCQSKQYEGQLHVLLPLGRHQQVHVLQVRLDGIYGKGQGTTSCDWFSLSSNQNNNMVWENVSSNLCDRAWKCFPSMYFLSICSNVTTISVTVYHSGFCPLVFPISSSISFYVFIYILLFPLQFYFLVSSIYLHFMFHLSFLIHST